MSNLRIKLFASATTGELEKEVNHWLGSENIKLQGYTFATDGLEFSYHCMFLFSPNKETGSGQSGKVGLHSQRGGAGNEPGQEHSV